MTGGGEDAASGASLAAGVSSTQASTSPRSTSTSDPMTPALSSLEAQHAVVKKENGALQHELDAIKSRVARELYERKMPREKTAKLQSENDCVRRELKISMMVGSRMADEKAALEQQVAKLGTDRSRLATECWTGQRALDSLRTENKRLERGLQALKGKAEEAAATGHASKMNELNKGNLVLSNGVAVLTIKCRALETKLTAVQAELEALKSENARLEEESRSHSARVEELTATTDALTATNVDAQLVLAAVNADKSRLEAESVAKISMLAVENVALHRQLAEHSLKITLGQQSAFPPAKRRCSIGCIGSLPALTTPRARRFVARKRLNF